MRKIGPAIGAGIGLFLFVIVLAFGGWAWRYYTAEVKGVVSAEEQIQSANSRIYNYEHFYNLCSTIQGNEAALRSQERLLKQEGVDKHRVLANISGLEAQRTRNIARYNADARKTKTRGQFLGEDLPNRLSPKADETRCRK